MKGYVIQCEYEGISDRTIPLSLCAAISSSCLNVALQASHPRIARTHFVEQVGMDVLGCEIPNL